MNEAQTPPQPPERQASSATQAGLWAAAALAALSLVGVTAFAVGWPVAADTEDARQNDSQRTFPTTLPPHRSGKSALAGKATALESNTVTTTADRPTRPIAPVTKPLPPGVRPNELGRVPILMYHSVGDQTTYRGKRFDIEGLNIHADTFRSHMEKMRKANWWPVNLCDLMRPGRVQVPAGKTPVVLTFDDARQSQFRYQKNGQIDPNCFVGMLLAFHKKYPDEWPLAATFFVLPYSKYNPLPFQQAGSETKKLKFLVDNGFEIANHSTSHGIFSRMDASRLKWEISYCTNYIRKLEPRAQMETVALPYGIRPRSRALSRLLLHDGTEKSSYTNRVVVLAAGGPSFAPMDKRFDNLQATRIGPQPGNVELWIERLRQDNKKSAYKPFISDGDATALTVPKPLVKFVAANRLGRDLRLLAYTLPTPPSPKPKTKKKPLTTVAATSANARR